MLVWPGKSFKINERVKTAVDYTLIESGTGEYDLRIHDLRHAYAIALAESGCPMHDISYVLGHHSVDFTRKHYARFSPESSSRSVYRVLEGRRAARR
jgi:integrase